MRSWARRFAASLLILLILSILSDSFPELSGCPLINEAFEVLR
jgi:hypothetical protein